MTHETAPPTNIGSNDHSGRLPKRTIGWHEMGLDWALADALDPAPGSSRDWTCNDMARAFAAGAAAAAMPGNAPLIDQVGLSPEPDFLLGCEDGGAVRCYYEWTVMQLLASERERLAKLCDQVINAVETGRGHAVGAAKCALAIRGA